MNLQVDTVYTDFRKAFDKANHDILIDKLAVIGFSGTLLCWLHSYITECTQSVRGRDSVSSKIYATSGVPQRSHLGSLLGFFSICQ